LKRKTGGTVGIGTRLLLDTLIPFYVDDLLISSGLPTACGISMSVRADRNFKGPFYTLGHVGSRLRTDAGALERGLASVGERFDKKVDSPGLQEPPRVRSVSRRGFLTAAATARALEPSGYVSVGAELWRAELSAESAPVATGSTVRIIEVRGIALFAGSLSAAEDS
jgi:hypothetical protein